jgi:hypothetical protein
MAMRIQLVRVRALSAALVLAVSACGPAAPVADGEAMSFASAEEAVLALIEAMRAPDQGKLLAVLGASAAPLVDSGDPVADRNTRERFAKAYDRAHTMVESADGDVFLRIGEDEWPFPIPIVQVEGGGGWRFDTDRGQEELVNRRIGANELSAIQVCLAYADAQREYYLRNPEGDPIAHYARRFASSEGKRDGLYWEEQPGEPPSPLGPGIDRARAEGYDEIGDPGDPTTQQGYHGYRYRILESQGPSAPGGAYDYVVRDRMLGGFAMVAYPSVYDVSGVMTFIVNHRGVVYQKDLGPDGASVAKAMTAFDPDETWTEARAD